MHTLCYQLLRHRCERVTAVTGVFSTATMAWVYWIWRNNSSRRHFIVWILEGQLGAHEGQHGAHGGNHGAHEGQLGAHKRQYGAAPCYKWLDETWCGFITKPNLVYCNTVSSLNCLYLWFWKKVPYWCIMNRTLHTFSFVQRISQHVHFHHEGYLWSSNYMHLLHSKFLNIFFLLFLELLPQMIQEWRYLFLLLQLRVMVNL